MAFIPPALGRHRKKYFFKTTVVTAILSLAPTFNVHASCSNSMGLVDCYNSFFEPATASGASSGSTNSNQLLLDQALLTNTANGLLGDKLRMLPTGLDLDGTLSTVTDLLPTAGLSMLTEDTLGSNSGGQSPQGLALNFNFVFPYFFKRQADKNAQFKAILNRSPKVTPLLRRALLDANELALLTRLEDDLSLSDDLQLALFFSLNAGNLGRDFFQYQDRLAGLVQAIKPKRRSILGTTLRRYGRHLQPGANSKNPKFSDFCKNNDCSSAESIAMQTELRVATENQAREERAIILTTQANLLRYSVPAFSSLINNQPQLLLKLNYRERNDLVGSREYKAGVAWESGRHNISHFERTAGKNSCAELENWGLNSRDSKQKDCAKAYASYIADNAHATRDGGRIAAGLEYSALDSIDIDLPDVGVNIEVPRTSKISAYLGYGQIFGSPGRFFGRTRLDVVGRYDRAFNEVFRHDRYVFSATVSQKFGVVSIPFTLYYSSNDEFRAGPNEELSAHLGLNFDLFSGSIPSVDTGLELAPPTVPQLP